MKSFAGTLLAFALLSFCLCGSKATGPTGPTAGQSAFVSDTMVIRHILDTNGISVGYSVVVEYQTNQTRITTVHLNKPFLGGGTITVLPASIGNLSELVSLSLDTNQLTTLPSTIGNLHKLTQLSLTHNRLTTLPSEIGQCTLLGALSLSDNQLTALPASITSLTRLHALFIDKNLITTTGLPTGLTSLTAIQALQVNNNHICNLQEPLLTMFNIYAEPDWATTQLTCQ